MMAKEKLNTIANSMTPSAQIFCARAWAHNSHGASLLPGIDHTNLYIVIRAKKGLPKLSIP